MPPNLSCAILFLISEVSKTHKGIVLLGTPPPKIEPVGSENESTDEEDSDSEDADEDRSHNKKKKSKARKLKKELKAKKAQIEVDKFIKTSNIQFQPEEEIKKISSIAPPVINPIVDLNQSDVIEIKDEKECLITEYDPALRNPSYCGAQLTLAYELSCLSQHFHPSVALFAQTLLNQNYIKYDGNPLKDFTVGRFLERFVYRNAKAKRVSIKVKHSLR